MNEQIQNIADALDQRAQDGKRAEAQANAANVKAAKEKLKPTADRIAAELSDYRKVDKAAAVSTLDVVKNKLGRDGNPRPTQNMKSATEELDSLVYAREFRPPLDDRAKQWLDWFAGMGPGDLVRRPWAVEKVVTMTAEGNALISTFGAVRRLTLAINVALKALLEKDEPLVVLHNLPHGH